MNNLHSTLVELVKKAWDANIKEDPSFFQKFMTDDAVGITGYGIVDKQTLLKQMEEHTGTPFTKYTLEDPKVISLTPESAILIYKITIEAVRNGQEMTFQDFATTVFVKRDNLWKGVLQQHSRIPEQKK